jgi:MFS family permease
MFMAILLISLMLVVFTHTNNFYLMCLSRVLIGVGASFATVLYMKSAAEYASPKAFGFISSLLATATMLGAACGGAPIALLFHKLGWHHGLNLVAAFGFLMAFSTLLFLKTTISDKSVTPTKFIAIKEVITTKNNWLLLLYSGLTFSPVAILGGLWGTPFLMTKYLITSTNASLLLSIMFIGHAIGSPLWALLSAKLKNKNDLMHLANGIAFFAILGIIYGNFSYSSSLVLFFIFGFSVGCFMLSFELCREMNAIYVIGFAVAFINSGEGIIGTLVEPLIGHILDFSKTGGAFTIENYRHALCVIPCCFIFSSIILLFIRQHKKTLTLKELARI